MARISQDDFSGQSDTSTDTNTLNIEANGQDSIEAPSNDFIADADMSREGQDLVLEAPNGDTLIINNYFMVDPAPTIESPDGSILTPNLVHSFLTSPAEFAQASSMADESPVGAVEEISGEATVIHADGTSEEMTLGTPIYQGDIIETSGDGAVNLVFIDETSMAVSSNARLSVDEYQFDPSTESGETNLSVLRGVFVFTSGLIGRDDPDDVMIDTPVGSIGIRGTIIAGNINPGGESEITVVEGAIVVTNGAMETTLSQQYESVRLGGFNDNMQEVGVKDAQEVGKTYGSVSDVVPKLFSSINDTVKEQVEEQAADAKEENADGDILEEVAEELDVQEEVQDPQNETPLDTGLETGAAHPAPAEGRHEPTDRRHHNAQRDGQEGNNPNAHDEIHFNNNGQNPDGPNFNFSTQPVFERSEMGTLVAKAFVGNVPAGTTFSLTGAGASNYDLIINGNVADIVLSSTGAAVTDSTVGTPLGAITVITTLPNGETITRSLSPNVADAAVNIGVAGGLDYDVDNIGAVGAQTKTFDLNNDGHNETIVGDGTDITGGFAAGKVTLTDGQTSVPTDTTGAAGDTYGHAVDSIGDFDGDGKTDYAVTAIGFDGGAANEGRAYIELGGSTVTVTGNASGQLLGDHIKGIGDTNGDGLSDILITNSATVGGNHEAYVIFGGTTGNIDTSSGSLSGNGFKISTPHDIKSAGFVGDTNGDGFDDFAVSLQMGGDINTFVIYGNNGFPSTLDMAYLENPDNALKIHHAGAGSAAEYNVSAAGDVDGDGFDDVQVGEVGGTQFVVHGDIADMGGTVPYVTDGHGSDSNGNAGIVGASADDQSLVGDVHFIDNSHTGLSMKGGGSDNFFSIEGDVSGNASFKDINGGNGLDTVKVNTDVDFSAINFEQISQIERLEIGTDYTKITLTAENLFNLLKSSDDGNLHIESSASTGAELEITTGGTGAASTSDIVAALNSEGSGATHVEAAGGYDHYQIGDYHLYIADDIAVVNGV